MSRKRINHDMTSQHKIWCFRIGRRGMYEKKGYQFVLNEGDIIHTWSAGKERKRIGWEKVRRGSSDAGAEEKCEQENNWKFEIKWIWTMKCWTHPVVISNKEEEEARKKTFGILRSNESEQRRSRWVRRWSSGLKSDKDRVSNDHLVGLCFPKDNASKWNQKVWWTRWRSRNESFGILRSSESKLQWRSKWVK